MRTFIGIKLENKYKLKIDNIKGYLFQNGIRGNYTDTNNIHLTLSFIGEVSESNVSVLKDIASNINIDDFFIEVTGIEVFKSYLILKVNKTEKLMEVQRQLTNKLLEKGFDVDEKNYFPHITIIRKPVNINSGALFTLNKNINIVSCVNEITVFESVRINGELKYISL